jgi:DNA-directed RNA polymerase subunit K/omega
MSDDVIPAPALEAAVQAAKRVRELEARADEALHGRGDAAGPRELMIEKCETLAGLPEIVEPLLGKSPGPAAEEFLSGLADISPAGPGRPWTWAVSFT